MPEPQTLPILTKDFVVSQNALSIAAEQILPVTRTRRRVAIRNLDTSIVVYIGHSSAVSSANGWPLLGGTGAGESIALYTQAAVWAIAASGTPVVAIIEEAD